MNYSYTSHYPLKKFKTAIFTSIFLLLAVILISCKSNNEQTLIIKNIDQNWQFSQANEEKWLPATVPGTVHSDLLKNGAIPHPFYACNEDSLQWIDKQDWEYKTTFIADKALLEKENICLIFEGLDTYAEIKLNNTVLGNTNNMFREWAFDISDIVRSGKNELNVIFKSAYNQTYSDSASYRVTLPGGKYVFARKAAYHFGWDWGPTFITSGIWKPVYLKAWNNNLVENFYIKTKTATPDKATINISFDIENRKNEDAKIEIKVNSKKHLQSSFSIDSLRKTYNISLEIDKPKLWWCNGLGEPYLYDIDVQITSTAGLIYSKQIRYGIRTVEVVSEPDSIGQSMYIKLNGTSVFIKGANYIPQHSFVTEVTDKDYANIISLAKESNMNMLRVWGGGIYENDIFYDLCDQNGIMVWQDFMFACAMYPIDSQFFDNVSIEAEQQIKRLRNHTSLAMWCGNNEIDEGWHNWGWQRQFKFSKADSSDIWNGYKHLFHNTLPNHVLENDRDRFYTTTSPIYGWGRNKSMTHYDSHYWGVWWGMQPFSKYLDKVPRFMSEYGFQAMPAKSTIRTFQPETCDSLFSPALLCHQKHRTGYQTITKYLEYEKLYPKTLDDFIYMNQLIQAEGIGLAIEAHRRAKPLCMGTLYWQLNDCWPVTSWSSADFYDTPKMLQYKVKELFDNVMISLLKHNDSIDVFVVSDKLSDIKGEVTLSAIDFSGKRETLFNKAVTVPTNSSVHAISLSATDLFEKFPPETTLFEATFKNGDNIYTNRKFLAPLGTIKVPEAEYNIDIKPINNGYELLLEAKTLMAYVHLSLGDKLGKFSKNHFTLLPNEKIVVILECDLGKEDVESLFTVKCLQ